MVILNLRRNIQIFSYFHWTRPPSSPQIWLATMLWYLISVYYSLQIVNESFILWTVIRATQYWVFILQKHIFLTCSYDGFFLYNGSFFQRTLESMYTLCRVKAFTFYIFHYRTLNRFTTIYVVNKKKLVNFYYTYPHTLQPIVLLRL